MKLAALPAAGAIGAADLLYVEQAGVAGKATGTQVKTWAQDGAVLTTDIDTDTTLAANSDALLPSQKAVKAYVDNNVVGLIELKGNTDCSATPNYPAALKGDAYYVTVAGKIGGAAGAAVDVGDVYIAKADNAGGTQAAVGASWFVIEHNIAAMLPLTGGTLTGPLDVPDDAYDATSWNGSTEVPTKNALRDKIEGLIAGVPSAYTDEMARDAIGAALVQGTNITITVNDGADTITIDGISTEAVQDIVGALLADSSTIDVTYNDAGNVESIDVIQTALKPTESMVIACGDETTAITATAGKVTWRMPYAFTVTEVRASLTTAQTSGSIFTVDINEAGASIISTKLTIDNTEKTSTTAATPAVISDASLADDAEMSIDVDQIGDGTAKGLKVVLIGHRT